jgi:Ser/Thr protein kinase RdoA (MazF antagonist)
VGLMVKISEETLLYLNNKFLNALDIDNICRQYNIGKLRYIHTHFKKTSNINLLIETDKGIFIAKLFRLNTDHTQNIIRVMKILHQYGIPVLLPVQNVHHQYFTRYNDFNVHVTPFIYEHHFNGNHHQMLSSGKTLRKIHDLMMGLHEISDPRSSIYPSSKTIFEGLKSLEDLKHGVSRKQIAIIRYLHDEIFEQWERLSNGIPYTVIHGDWNERNMLFTDKGEVCCIFDFDYVQKKRASV